MNTNSKQSTGKTYSGAVFRGIVMLFGLFAFIWLPAPEVGAALQLISPTDDDFVEPVTVFRWTRSDNPAVHSYRLIIAEDPNLDPIDLDLPKPGDSIIAPQVAVRLGSDLGVFEGVTLHWRVIGLDQDGDPVEESQQVFSFTFFTDQRGFTVITGLVKSDLNQLGLAGARVAVSSSVHAATTNSIVETVFNGQYIAIAVSTDNDGVPIPFPIEITSTKDGFKPTTVLLQEAEKVNGVITRDVLMKDDVPLSSSLRLKSPLNKKEDVEPVTVFRWTRSDNPAVHSYRLIIANDSDMTNETNIQLSLPKPGDSIVAPQVAVNLRDDLADFRDVPLYWRVIGLDQAGDPVEQGQEVFSFLFIADQRGFTVITGLVKSDLNQLGLVGAQIAVSSARHTGTTNNIVETVFNGEYIAVAVTTDNDRVPIPFPIEITSTKEGFQTTTVILQESEKINGVITRDLTMMSDGDGETDPSLLNTGVLPAILSLLLGD